MVRGRLSFILEQAILQAIKNPPQPVKGEKVDFDDLNAITENSLVIQPVDFFAYHDAIQLMHDTFALQKGEVIELHPNELLTQDKIDARLNAIYAFNQTDCVNQENDSDIFIANHQRLIVTKKISVNGFKSEVGRLVGMNNLNNSMDAFFKDKDGVLIQPYELTTIVKKEALGGVSPDYAYEMNPLHPCFHHVLSPSPVMGYALEGDLKRLIGYVVHAKMLFKLLSSAKVISNINLDADQFRLKDHMALQYDTQTALKLLEYRYCIDVDKESVENIAEFDKKLEEFSTGACCIELPDF